VIHEADLITKKIGPVRLGVVDAEFSTDGQTIAAIVNEGKDLKVWNTLTGKLIRTQPAKRDMSSCYFSPDLKVIYCGYELWDVAKGNLIRKLPQPEGSNLVFSSDGKTFATSAEAVPGTTKDDTLIGLWDFQTGKLKTTLKGHLTQVSSAQFSSDGQLFVTGSHDGTVRLWDVASGEPKHVFVLTDLQTNPN
jgi:WD40 repeat protein